MKTVDHPPAHPGRSARWVRFFVFLLFLLISAGCSGNRQPDAWERVQAAGTLRVGMDVAYPPFEFVNEETGEIEGFDVDLAREIGSRLGLDIELVNITYDGLYDALATGQVDVLISALVVSHDVEAKADFTEPYFNAGQHLVSSEESGINEMPDLDGHTLAVEYGSGGDVEARAWERRLAALEITRHETPDEALQAVLSGEADAALVDGISARLGAGQYDDLVTVTNVTDSLFAVAVGEEEDALRARVDAVVAELMRDGTINRLIIKWFGEQR